MYTLFEQIICHRCVFASVSRTRAPRDALAHPAAHLRTLFPASLLWSPRNISLEWTM